MDLDERVVQLEKEVADLKRQLKASRAAWDAVESDFRTVSAPVIKCRKVAIKKCR